MTYQGGLMAITRHGLKSTNVGTLQKATYEESDTILSNAAVHGVTDIVEGVSENIIMGQISNAGTGSVKVILDTKQLSDLEIVRSKLFPTENLFDRPVTSDYKTKDIPDFLALANED